MDEKLVGLRPECNRLLENVVELYLKTFPELRFIQMLWGLNIIDSTYIQNEEYPIIDRFYEEPYDTVVRILPEIEALINDYFPKDPTIIMKILRANIFTRLERLNLAHKTDDFKLCINE